MITSLSQIDKEIKKKKNHNLANENIWVFFPIWI